MNFAAAMLNVTKTTKPATPAVIVRSDPPMCNYVLTTTAEKRKKLADYAKSTNSIPVIMEPLTVADKGLFKVEQHHFFVPAVYTVDHFLTSFKKTIKIEEGVPFELHLGGKVMVSYPVSALETPASPGNPTPCNPSPVKMPAYNDAVYIDFKQISMIELYDGYKCADDFLYMFVSMPSMVNVIFMDDAKDTKSSYTLQVPGYYNVAHLMDYFKQHVGIATGEGDELLFFAGDEMIALDVRLSDLGQRDGCVRLAYQAFLRM